MFILNCKKNKEYMLKYIEGTLNEKETLILSEHIEKCSECREEFFAYCQIFDEIDEYNKFTNKVENLISKDFESNVMKKISVIDLKTEKVLISLIGVISLSVAFLLFIEVDKNIVFNNNFFSDLAIETSINFIDKTVVFLGLNIVNILKFIFEYLMLLKPFSLCGVIFTVIMSFIYNYLHRGEKNV